MTEATKRRVLVTGGTTPLGRELLRQLLADPRVESVLAVGLEPPEDQRLPRANPNFAYQRVDLMRSRSLRNLLFGPVRQRAIDTVIHLALHRRAQDQGRHVHRLNVEATRELLHLCERHPTIRRFVFRGFAEVYDVRSHRPVVIGEEHPLNLSPVAPQWVRDRVEADLTVCTRMGMAPVTIAVLRCAECLAPDSGSQLYDYLRSKVCLRPLGFDPMLEVATPQDLGRALRLAALGTAQGVFNIPGRDVLPLSRLIRLWGRRDVTLPGPMLQPLYRLRTLALGTDFRYDLNFGRFHFSAVLDGRRAAQELGYTPQHGIEWTGVLGPPASDPADVLAPCI